MGNFIFCGKGEFSPAAIKIAAIPVSEIQASVPLSMGEGPGVRPIY